jgi:hypothetical protein
MDIPLCELVGAQSVSCAHADNAHHQGGFNLRRMAQARTGLASLG